MNKLITKLLTFILLIVILIGAESQAIAAKKVSNKPQSSKPNILFIAVDDLKPMLACYGSDFMHTPNIDKLANKGALFTNAHCQQAVCGPSRPAY